MASFLSNYIKKQTKHITNKIQTLKKKSFDNKDIHWTLKCILKDRQYFLTSQNTFPGLITCSTVRKLLLQHFADFTRIKICNTKNILNDNINSIEQNYNSVLITL